MTEDHPILGKYLGEPAMTSQQMADEMLAVFQANKLENQSASSQLEYRLNAVISELTEFRKMAENPETVDLIECHKRLVGMAMQECFAIAKLLLARNRRYQHAA